MYQSQNLTPATKQSLKDNATKHIHDLGKVLQTKIDRLNTLIEEQKASIPELEHTNLFSLDPDTPERELTIAKIKMYDDMVRSYQFIQNAPYFLRLDVTWKETGESETIYISKYNYTDAKIYSWVSPVSTLRFADIGNAEYLKPNGEAKQADISRKDNYIIANGDIVFMTYTDAEHNRQVVYQKHIDQRREFLLPEIVAELDRLQDQIIRSDPHGSFLISGPAGSGKTTLALHRVAYLVLTPEFNDYFQPDRIMVFVADEGAVTYFNKLLPELGINGVRITTFSEWGMMIVNSRFRGKANKRFGYLDLDLALDYISKHNPLPQIHPRLILDEYRKLKQEMIMPIKIKEGSPVQVFPELHKLYLAELDPQNKLAESFKAYLAFQKQHNYLDEVDITVLLQSLENPIEPFVHIVVDEVQNWLPAQLSLVKSLTTHNYKSVTFIGDIRQKTKAFSINDWSEVEANFLENVPNKIELLKVYRNTKPILEYLHTKGYDVVDMQNARGGKPVSEISELTQPAAEFIKAKIAEIEQEFGKVQIGILTKYQTDLANLEHLAYDQENVHVLTIEAAQGLEFHSVILMNADALTKGFDYYLPDLGYVSAEAYSEQDKHLFYVAATRAQEQLIVVNSP